MGELHSLPIQKQMKHDKTIITRKIDKLVARLQKININIELGSSYPWVYLEKVNGVRVTETYWSEHGYTICFLTGECFLHLGNLFKLLRKYK